MTKASAGNVAVREHKVSGCRQADKANTEPITHYIRNVSDFTPWLLFIFSSKDSIVKEDTFTPQSKYFLRLRICGHQVGHLEGILVRLRRLNRCLNYLPLLKLFSRTQS